MVFWKSSLYEGGFFRLYEMIDPGEWDTQCGIESCDIYKDYIRFFKLMGPDEWDIRYGIGLHDIYRFFAG